MWPQQLVKHLLCLWVHNTPQLCHCRVQWHVLSKPWKELLEVTSGNTWARCYQGCDPQRACGVSCGSSLALQSIPVALGCFSFKLWYLAEGAANVGHLKTFNGVGLILAFGTAGFSDHEAAQALSLTWLLLLFSYSRSLCWSLIITLFSVELSNLFLAASEESYSSYWFVVLRILTRVSVFVLVFLLLFPVMWIPSLDLCTMVLIYLVTILYWEGIFKNCDFRWIFLPFDFFSYLKRHSHLYKKGISFGPWENVGAGIKIKQMGFYIISVCIWYIDQYLYKFNLLFSW